MPSFWLLIAILVLTVVAIYVYGWIVKKYLHQDYMLAEVIPAPGGDIWAISHLLLYTLLGYLFPQWIFPLFLLGIAWEVLEQLTGNPEVRQMVVGEFRANKWWYGRVSDVVFNGIGLLLGYALATS